jgi:hypothetical protein
MKKKKLKNTGDLRDPARDGEKLQGDQASLDLPEVSDIPGQENIIPPKLGEFADTTASSADEEYSGEEKLMDNRSNVSDDEIKLLDKAFQQDKMEGVDIDDLALDNKDEEGDPLNEGDLEKDLFGEDLDSPLVDEEDSEAEGEEEDFRDER